MKKNKNKLKEHGENITLLLIALIFFFFLSEIFLAMQYENFHKEKELLFKEKAPCIIASEDKQLIYTFKPNCLETNSKGYIDFEYPYKKPENTFRIILIGDSVAAGFGTNIFKESFGKVLEKKLNENSKKKFEVIILARAGYSTSQELVLLKKEAFLYEPDLIIWSYVFNDPMHPIYHDADNEAGKYFYKPDSYFINFISEKMFFIKEKIIALNCKKEYEAMINCVYWPEIQKNIKEIGIKSEEKNTPIIFLIHPIFEENAFKEYSLKEVHEKLAFEAEKNQLIVFDLLNAFKGFNAKELKQNSIEWYDPYHPNAKGHKLIANYLYEKLVNDYNVSQ